MHTISLPGGETVPLLGQGTWNMGDDARRRATEIAALQSGIDLGMTLIDTAEMYGGGASEILVGEAIAGRRERVFLVSKVLPDNATRNGTVAACERSLKRLGTDRIDLYLLHWRGRVALQETLDGLLRLQRDGKIRHWGVSNFDLADMEELHGLEGGDQAATDQVLYNLSRRGIEFDLLPWCARHRMPVMAYSPVEQGRLLSLPELRQVAARHQATPAQVALAWLLRDRKVTAIPKAATPAHVRDNSKALELELDNTDLQMLDQAFPPPSGAQPLEMI